MRKQSYNPRPDPGSSVEQDQVAVHSPRRRDARGNHPRLQVLDELPVVRRGQHVGVGDCLHSARPFSKVSASFSNRQNSASKSFAGVGGNIVFNLFYFCSLNIINSFSVKLFKMVYRFDIMRFIEI
ncbi:MAG: hypothetical protein NTV89_16370 [Proteobacteria bacterium]|nr:hypothetical protein [Pseudomonadota bacterium]